MFPEDLIESGQPGNSLPASSLDKPGFQPLRFETAARESVPEPTGGQRLWVHVALLLATLFTTTLVGAHMQYNFARNLPFIDLDHLWQTFTVGLRSPALFLAGLPFSLTLLTILMAHELGHYVACVYYGIDASLPYFLPSPMPVTGTFGAFIRIRSAIYSKRVLFDVGIAGPIAGFIFLVPALGVGLAFSKILPGVNRQSTIQLGMPALEWIAQKLIFPGIPTADIYLHPVTRAAWVGMFATAFNLLPVGQLDGGHIVYTLSSRVHKWFTSVFLILLAGELAALVFEGRRQGGLAFWSSALLFFMFFMFFFLARKHPPLFDPNDIGTPRKQLMVVALCIFLLCFSIVPLSD